MTMLTLLGALTLVGLLLVGGVYLWGMTSVHLHFRKLTKLRRQRINALSNEELQAEIRASEGSSSNAP
jgi:hypothetical protein